MHVEFRGIVSLLFSPRLHRMDIVYCLIVDIYDVDDCNGGIGAKWT